MNPKKLARRFLIPAPAVSLFYYFKFGCKISPRAEVEMSPYLTFGKNTQVSSFCKIKASDGPVVIGREVSIGASCFISSDRMGVKIGDYCLIGPNVSIIGNNYNYDRLDIPICRQGTQSAGISIEDNVWIGAGTVVLDGASIGHGAIIAPNSVVSARIPENTIAQGSPAKVIFKRR